MVLNTEMAIVKEEIAYNAQTSLSKAQVLKITERTWGSESDSLVPSEEVVSTANRAAIPCFSASIFQVTVASGKHRYSQKKSRRIQNSGVDQSFHF